jgi:PhoH-like ATPase
MSKVYIVDTNVFAHDYHAIDNLSSKSARLVIPYVVLEELDGLKVRQDQTGRNARHAIRRIEELEKSSKVFIADDPTDYWIKNNDDKIIATAIDENRGMDFNRVIVLSKDIALRVKAKKHCLEVQDYKNDQVDSNHLYSGFGLGFPNEPVIENGKVVDSVSGSELAKINPSGLFAANIEQQVAIHHCMNREIPLVSLVGAAGTGKTLVAIACALEAIEWGLYDKVTIARPIMPFQKDIGFLPGDVDEKILPWFAPIRDNLDYLFNIADQDSEEKKRGKREPHEELVDLGIIEFCPLTYIRGRSLARQIIIVDESQNATPSELRTILTRVGEGSKIILTGDYTQIDSPYLSSDTNGLVYCVERFKDSELSAHVTLTECKRSELARESAERL